MKQIKEIVEASYEGIRLSPPETFYYECLPDGELITHNNACLINGSSLMRDKQNKITFENSSFKKLTTANDWCMRAVHLQPFGNAVEFPELVLGVNSFAYCAFTSWSKDFPKMTNGDSCFLGAKIETYRGTLPVLSIGTRMFNKSSLRFFYSPLPSLIHGYQMFDSCPLETFDSELPALSNGAYMFCNTKLDASSIDKILESLPAWSTGEHVITFTGCPGAAECHPDIATRKGWNVIL